MEVSGLEAADPGATFYPKSLRVLVDEMLPRWAGREALTWGPLPDAWILTGSIIATYGMARGWIEFWLVWIAVDVVGVANNHGADYGPAGLRDTRRAARTGAVVLRSDGIRKGLHGVPETERLPSETYTAVASERVYGEFLRRAAPIRQHQHIRRRRHIVRPAQDDSTDAPFIGIGRVKRLRRHRDRDNARDIVFGRAGYLVRRYSSLAMTDEDAVAEDVVARRLRFSEPDPRG